MDLHDNAKFLNKYTRLTDWNRGSNNTDGESVLALDRHFDALMYFDEVHFVYNGISDEFFDVCMQMASKYRSPPFDEPRLASKVDEGIYLIGEGIIAGYKSVLEYYWSLNHADFGQVLEPLNELPDSRERHAVESMIVAQCAVQADVSGASSYLIPDYLQQKAVEASTAESSPIIEFTNIGMVDTSQLNLSQVLEMRQDPEFRQSLRKLRYFLTQNFSGLPPAQIEDKFLTLLESHDKALSRATEAKVTQSLSCFLGTSFWPSTILLAATLLGQTVPETKQMIAAGGVIALSAGRTLLEFRKAQLKYMELREHPIDYVFKARQLSRQT